MSSKQCKDGMGWKGLLSGQHGATTGGARPECVQQDHPRNQNRDEGERVAAANAVLAATTMAQAGAAGGETPARRRHAPARHGKGIGSLRLIYLIGVTCHFYLTCQLTCVFCALPS
jgi:hypothetical protein